MEPSFKLAARTSGDIGIDDSKRLLHWARPSMTSAASLTFRRLRPRCQRLMTYRDSADFTMTWTEINYFMGDAIMKSLPPPPGRQNFEIYYSPILPALRPASFKMNEIWSIQGSALFHERYLLPRLTYRAKRLGMMRILAHKIRQYRYSIYRRRIVIAHFSRLLPWLTLIFWKSTPPRRWLI